MEYANKYLWDIPREWNIGTETLPLRERIKDMPRKGRVDFDGIIESEYGEKLITNMKYYILYKDEMDPELLEYYRSIGLNKRLFNKNELYAKWALYTPVSMEKEENKDKAYPLLFINHGATMPIHWEESSGFLPIAGREEMIVISAQNHNVDNLLKLLKFIEDNYPIDRSRIYATGYSQGGFKTLKFAYNYPDLFAAIAPCGAPLSLPDEVLPMSVIEKGKVFDIPGITICGQEESLEYFPMNQENVSLEIMGPDRHGKSLGEDPTTSELFNPNLEVIPISAKSRIAMYNKRRISLRRQQVSFTDCLKLVNSENEVERKLGIPADKIEIKVYSGVRHFISTVNNGEGKPFLKIVSVEGQPHWPIATMPEISWDYMKHFRRDTVTKKIIIDNKES